MQYVSNLQPPDRSSWHFKFREPPLQIKGHDVPSDPDFEPACTFLSHDEATILYHCAWKIGGMWMDVGARFGWTAKHIQQATGQFVTCVDPDYHVGERRDRFQENTDFPRGWTEYCMADVASYHESMQAKPFSGFCIDGNHDSPEPTRDADECLKLARDRCVFVFHDMWGLPIRDGVRWLMARGFQCRVYYTPNGMAVCWRGEFCPPDHVRDPAIDWSFVQRDYTDFDWSACGG